MGRTGIALRPARRSIGSRIHPAVRRERGFDVNPWTTHSRFLISQRLLIDEAYAGPLRDWLDNFCPGSLLILDEAHHAAPSGGQRYAIDSHITKAVRDFAPRFEHRLFLSATPRSSRGTTLCSSNLAVLHPRTGSAPGCRVRSRRSKRTPRKSTERRYVPPCGRRIKLLGVPRFPHHPP